MIETIVTRMGKPRNREHARRGEPPVHPRSGGAPAEAGPLHLRAELARLTLGLLLLAGVGIAVYLARHHENQLYGDPSVRLANCPQSETVDCEAVNTSAWSELLGVPIAAYAVPTYLLVLGLLWRGRREPRLTSYAFGIGLLATLASAFLWYVSSVKVGFLCVWCLRLYAINAAIPVLAGIAAWRAPLVLAREALRDIGAWPRPMRRAGVTFAALLAATVAAQQAYRAVLKSEARTARAAVQAERAEFEALERGAAESATPAGLPSPGPPDLPRPPGLAQPQAPSAPGAPALPSSLRRLTGGRGEARVESFDLGSRIGQGRPVALVFWAPGYWLAERGLVEIAEYLRAAAPEIEAYAVAGPREGLRDEAILESYALLRMTAPLPLLVDGGYALAASLGVREPPSLVVFDGRGRPALTQIRHPRQPLATEAGARLASDLLRALASGQEVPAVTRAGPYYPGSALVGRCAPSFTLPAFGGGGPVSFGGRSASGRPTLLFFWSSTCKHCQAEIPPLLDWLRAHPGRADVVSVTQIHPDRPGHPSHRAVTAAYIRERRIPWAVLEDADGAVDELYGVVSTPTTFFVSPSGTVTGVWFYPQGDGLAAAMERDLARAAQAGGCAPAPPPPARLDLEMTGPDGRRVPLRSLLDRPALVHLWATWCAPCIQELPALLRFRDRLEREGAGRVVFVSVEEEEAGPRIAAFEKQHGFDLRSYRAPRGGPADALDLSYSVPRTFLVGPGGSVAGVRYGDQKWDNPLLAERVLSRLRNAPRAGL